MANVISLLIILAFVYFAAKKFVFPRLAAKRAAKPGDPAALTLPAGMAGAPDIAALQAAVQAGNRPVTCFDMRYVRTLISDDDEHPEETFSTRITHAANEMLLNASLRGTDVRLHVVYADFHAVMLYVTYTVR